MKRRGKQEIDFRRAEVERLLARRGEDEQQAEAQKHERQIRLGQPLNGACRPVVAHGTATNSDGTIIIAKNADREEDQKRAPRRPCARETAGGAWP